MTIVYEAQGFRSRAEFNTEADARALVETWGEGSVIKWAVDRNLPWAKPNYVYRSCALDVFEAGAWRAVNIHG